MALYSIDVPMAGRVTRASVSEPYLLLMIDLDAEKIGELALKVFPNGVPQRQDSRSLYVGDPDPYLIDAATRLVELMAHPADAELLAPLVRDEMLIRLLRSPMGPRVAEIGRAGSSVQRVAKAVTWLRSNYDQAASIEQLAKLVNMSVTSFHRQFRTVTGMSPLQYQKTLRLQEARRLMLTATMDAGAAGRRVGYLSASQFSREYSRFFGSAPAKDINRLRDQGTSASEAPG
jgi:AraC-like DNA-binding protein